MISTTDFDFATRTEVARSFCRSVAAIDDDIFDITDGLSKRRLSQLFEDLRRSCVDQGVLCHLHHYPRTSYNPDADDSIEDAIAGSAPVKEHFQRAVKAAEAADVVILDWNLGSSNSHQHSQEILRVLASSSAVRFVFIYTDASIQEVRGHLNDAFPNIKELAPPPKAGAISDTDEEEEEGEEDGSSVTGTASALPSNMTVEEGVRQEEVEHPLGFELDNHLFIFVGNKSHLFADRVIEAVLKALTRCFPDHIKWAGLEMAVRTRTLLPRVIAAMPEMTDGALLLQMLYQKENEVAEQVSQAILDDLRAALHEEPLKTVCDETLFHHLTSHMARLSGEESSETLKRITTSIGCDFVQKRDLVLAKKEQQRSAAEKKLLKFHSNWSQATLSDLPALRRQVSRYKIYDWFPHELDKDANSSEQALKLCESLGCYIESCSYEEAHALQAAVAWASMRESVMIETQRSSMQPGAILRRIKQEEVTEQPPNSKAVNAPEWLLCVTGACDCYRNKNGYLVVAGEIKPPNKRQSEQAQTQVAFKGQELVWDSGKLSKIGEDQIMHPITVQNQDAALDAEIPNATQEEKDDKVKSTSTTVISGDAMVAMTIAKGIVPEAKYEIVGFLRYEFGSRLIHRVWSHQTRVGVDSSEMLRQLRRE
jgi:hypothetical protein